MEQDLIQLLSTNSSRVFLQKALEIQYKNKNKINYSDFSRKAGFLSRSFLKEFISGKKNLSRQGLLQIKKALKLPNQYKRLFELLVFREQPSLASKNLSVTEIKAEIEKFIKILHQKKVAVDIVSDATPIVAKKELYQVFAGIGEYEAGSSLQEISSRTGLDPKVVATGLKILSSHGAVVIKGDKYFCNTTQLDFFNLAGKKEFTDLIKTATSHIHKNAEKLNANSNNYIFYTAFSVSKYDLPNLKKQLKEAVFDVLDKFQVDCGDTVEQMFLSMWNDIH